MAESLAPFSTKIIIQTNWTIGTEFSFCNYELLAIQFNFLRCTKLFCRPFSADELFFRLETFQEKLAVDIEFNIVNYNIKN